MNIDPLTTFIHDTFNQAGKHTAVVALSGGVDSATSFVLALKALGPDHVHAFYLPSKTSHPQHLKDIQLLTSHLTLNTSHFHLIPIGAIVQKFWRIISKSARIEAGIQEFAPAALPAMLSAQLMQAGGPRLRESRTQNSDSDEIIKNNRLRLANLTARIRMMVIFDQAKKLDALVVGTENRSEHLLGYYTRYGDEASDLEPIGHLYKTDVMALAKFLDIPQSIIDKPPSADLWPGQTDASELGFTYQQADPILKLIDQHKTKHEIITAGFEETLVKAIFNQVEATAFKHQVPYHIENYFSAATLAASIMAS